MIHVLVVDDSSVDRQLFEGLLRKEPQFQVLLAENGREALRQVAERRVDLVVTDLQMPHVDGLELVKSLRDQHPDIPTILATAYGSEEIANEALAAGAASYVPKAKAAELLLPTVRGVLEILLAERSYAELMARSRETRFEFVLDNDPKYIAPLGDLCNRMLACLSPLDRVERLRVSVALEHALKNAIYRGNLEIGNEHHFPEGDQPLPGELAALVEERMSRFGQRQLVVIMTLDRTRLNCLIRDQGKGFPHRVPPSIDDAAGRGLVIMHAFFDEVRFNDRGNEVELIRRWVDAEQPASAAAAVSDDDLLNIGEVETVKPLGKLHSNDPPITYEMHQESILVGSQKSCHVVLASSGIAPQHCQLNYQDGAWHFRALPSELGVLHNGRPAKVGKLISGDHIAFGKLVFSISY